MQATKKLLQTSRLRRLLKAFTRNPFSFIISHARFFWHDVKCFFFPYNVIRCSHLSRSWSDRDQLMFHAMFQIIVDFVELEQEFRDWPNRYKPKRYKDRKAMHEWIEKNFNTDEGRKSMYWESASQEDKNKTDLHTEKRYRINKEIMYLYEWYVDKKYDLDSFAVQEQTGTRLKMGHETSSEDGITATQIIEVSNGKPALITRSEAEDIELNHELVCNRMLERILAIRKYLWT